MAAKQKAARTTTPGTAFKTTKSNLHFTALDRARAMLALMVYTHSRKAVYVVLLIEFVALAALVGGAK